MYVCRVDCLEKLLPYRERWDELAGDCPFRGWRWLTTWWQHYGANQAGRALRVYLVFSGSKSKNCIADSNINADQLVGILPCYRATSLGRGSVLRLLGDGEVCSDHLDLLVDLLLDEQRVDTVVTLLAGALVNHADDWDVIDFEAIASESSQLSKLVASLGSRGCHVRRDAGPNCWSIDLPATWDELLAQQSKSHRKQLRRLERRVLDTERATWHLVSSSSNLDTAWDILVDLHQRRRKSLGEPGCFASRRWCAFHRDIATQLLDAGQLRLSWLDIEGQPVAAEYHMAGQHTTFAYQGGVEPDRLDDEPGRLSMIRTIQHAIAEGHTQFDLLRGDEPYKPHWRATPRATFNTQIVAPRTAAHWRYRSWNSLRRAGRLARQFASLLS